MIRLAAIPATVAVLKNSFQLIHPCPACLKTARRAWETMPAADHLPAKPAVQGPAAAVGRIGIKRKEMSQSKDMITIHVNIEIYYWSWRFYCLG
jgi:hypothetical protein